MTPWDIYIHDPPLTPARIRAELEAYHSRWTSVSPAMRRSMIQRDFGKIVGRFGALETHLDVSSPRAMWLWENGLASCVECWPPFWPPGFMLGERRRSSAL